MLHEGVNLNLSISSLNSCPPKALTLPMTKFCFQPKNQVFDTVDCLIFAQFFFFFFSNLFQAFINIQPHRTGLIIWLLLNSRCKCLLTTIFKSMSHTNNLTPD